MQGNFYVINLKVKWKMNSESLTHSHFIQQWSVCAWQTAKEYCFSILFHWISKWNFETASHTVLKMVTTWWGYASQIKHKITRGLLFLKKIPVAVWLDREEYSTQPYFTPKCLASSSGCFRNLTWVDQLSNLISLIQFPLYHTHAHTE